MEFAGSASNIYLNLSLLAKKCLAPKHFFVDTANHTKMHNPFLPPEKKQSKPNPVSLSVAPMPLYDSCTAGITVT